MPTSSSISQSANGARGMSEDFATFDCGCRCWHPATLQSALQQFVGRWLVIPDGDRRHHAESRNIVNERKPVKVFDEDVVTEFVLSHDIRERQGRLKAR